MEVKDVSPWNLALFDWSQAGLRAAVHGTLSTAVAGDRSDD